MRIAMIGVGMVAGTHLKAIASSQAEMELRGICASSTASCERFLDDQMELVGELAIAPVIYADVAEIVADPDVDFALVCTPPNARHKIVRMLAQCGKPILMEKPVERTLAAAERIVEMCEVADVPLGIVFQHRKREAAVALRQLFDAGRLGALVSVEVNVPWWRPQSYYDQPGRGTYERDGGGVLMNQAIHTLDLMLSFTGPAVEARSMVKTTAAHQMEAEDFVVAGIEFENGAVGSLFASTASYPGTPETLRMHCANASVHLQGNSLEVFWRDGRRESIGSTGGTGGGADPMAFSHGWHQAIIEDFAEALAEGRSPLINGREALKVHSLIESIEDGATG